MESISGTNNSMAAVPPSTVNKGARAKISAVRSQPLNRPRVCGNRANRMKTGPRISNRYSTSRVRMSTPSVDIKRHRPDSQNRVTDIGRGPWTAVLTTVIPLCTVVCSAAAWAVAGSRTRAISANLTNRPSRSWAKFITAEPRWPSSAAATSSGPPISRP